MKRPRKSDRQGKHDRQQGSMINTTHLRDVPPTLLCKKGKYHYTSQDTNNDCILPGEKISINALQTAADIPECQNKI